MKEFRHQYPRLTPPLSAPTNSPVVVARIVLIAGMLFHAAAAAAGEPVSFREDIAPLLIENCVACHAAKNAEAGYRVDTFAHLLTAGDSGELPIGRKEGETSELLRRLTTEEEYERMPAESEPLTEEEIKLVADWIASGAPFDGTDKNLSLPFLIPSPRYPKPPESYSAAIPVTALAFSPDGAELLASGYHEVTIWDVASGKLLRRIPNLGERIFELAFSPDGSTLAVACGAPGRNGEVRLIDFASGDVKAVLARATDVALDLAFRPGTTQLAIASADQRIQIIDVETLEEVRVLASHADWVTAVAWSDDGSRLVSASRDKSAKVFDGETGQLLISYKGHGAAVRGVAVSADRKHVFSTGSDAQLHRWNLETAKRVASVPLSGEGYNLTRGDQFLLLPTTGKQLLQIDLTETKVAKEFTGFKDWVLSAAWHPGSGRIAAGAFDGEIRVWNLSEGKLVRSWTAKP